MVLLVIKLIALNLKVMVLVYLGATVDATLEQELTSFTKNGFKVLIEYNTSSINAGIQIFSNATEVHYLFNRSCSLFPEVDSIAFESDIRGEGFTRKVIDIKVVTITLED